MPNWYAIPLALVLLGDADVPRVNSLRPPERPLVNFPSDEEIPIFPSAGDSTDGSQAQPKPASTPNQPLQENSKLTLIRFVSGEFAKAVKSLPAGKEGFNLIVGKPLDTQLLNRAVATRSEEHTSELQSLTNLVCRLLLEKKKKKIKKIKNKKYKVKITASKKKRE